MRLSTSVSNCAVFALATSIREAQLASAQTYSPFDNTQGDESLFGDVFYVNQATDRTVLELVQGTPVLTTLSAAFDAAGIVDEISSGTQPVTVMMPWNQAFDDLPAGTVEKLLEPGYVAHLQNVLRYHIHNG